MNVSTDDIAVIQTRLPYTDRRALSQAWLSALHIASENVGEERGRASAAPPGTDLCASLSQRRQKHASEGKRAAGALVWRTSPASPRQEGCGSVFAPERVRGAAVPVVLSRESASVGPSHVSFTLTVAGARTALHVRRHGGKVIVIAVCSARHTDLVRRALAEAAAVLRLQGESVDTTVRAVDGKNRT